MADLRRKESSLTDNKRRMIISVHRYFSGAHNKKEQHQAMPLCKRVATALGIGEGTVARVIADWNQRNDSNFTAHKMISRPLSRS
ncbi:6183_t:CDS:1, partial [Ambispora gerdemannii]